MQKAPSELLPPFDDDGPELFPLEASGISAAATTCNAATRCQESPEVFPPELPDRPHRKHKENEHKQEEKGKDRKAKNPIEVNERIEAQEAGSISSTAIQEDDSLRLFHPPGVSVPMRTSTHDEPRALRQPGAEFIPSSTRSAPAELAQRNPILLGEQHGESTHLVSASLVFPIPTVEAKRAPHPRNRKLLWIGSFVSLVVVAIVIIVSVIFSHPDSPKVDPTPAPTLVSDATRLLEILDPVLPDTSKDAILEINTPQNFAFQWLLTNDGLETYSDTRIRQRYALATIFYATNGRGWYNSTGWLENTDECDWYFSKAYSCDWYLSEEEKCDWNPSQDTSVCEDGVLKILHLPNNLLGTLPPDTSILSNLIYLSLHENALAGPIPSAIMKLTNLEYLDLSWNGMTGSIPSFIGQLTKLEYFGFIFNAITGSVPYAITKLTNLDYLNLSGNRLTGPIPSFISQLSNLKYLYLTGTALMGSIPVSLGQLTNLVELHLSENALTGSIPSSIAQLTNLDDLNLSGTSLTGSIISSIGQLTNLETLNLCCNALNGTIPFSIGQLTNLGSLDLWSNSLAGPFPSSIIHLTSLQYLNVNNNTLSGSIPSSFIQLTKLETLDLSATELTGSIPSELCNFTNLTSVWLDCNMVRCSCNDTCGCD